MSDGRRFYTTPRLTVGMAVGFEEMGGYELLECDSVVDLSDAPVGPDGSQHIHLTRLPDGTWSAVAMERIRTWGEPKYVWADVPTQPEEAGT